MAPSVKSLNVGFLGEVHSKVLYDLGESPLGILEYARYDEDSLFQEGMTVYSKMDLGHQSSFHAHYSGDHHSTVHHVSHCS